MDSIIIKDIEVFAYHGVTEEEQRDGQRFLVDVEIAADLTRAAATDDLSHTIDYAAVAGEVERIMTAERCDLIETVAGRIADAVLSFPGASRVSVTVKKPDAPMPVETGWVGVTVVRGGERA